MRAHQSSIDTSAVSRQLADVIRPLLGMVSDPEAIREALSTVAFDKLQARVVPVTELERVSRIAETHDKAAKATRQLVPDDVADALECLRTTPPSAQALAPQLRAAWRVIQRWAFYLVTQLRIGTAPGAETLVPSAAQIRALGERRRTVQEGGWVPWECLLGDTSEYSDTMGVGPLRRWIEETGWKERSAYTGETIGLLLSKIRLANRAISARVLDLSGLTLGDQDDTVLQQDDEPTMRVNHIALEHSPRDAEDVSAGRHRWRTAMMQEDQGSARGVRSVPDDRPVVGCVSVPAFHRPDGPDVCTWAVYLLDPQTRDAVLFSWVHTASLLCTPQEVLDTLVRAAGASSSDWNLVGYHRANLTQDQADQSGPLSVQLVSSLLEDGPNALSRFWPPRHQAEATLVAGADGYRAEQLAWILADMTTADALYQDIQAGGHVIDRLIARSVGNLAL